MLIAQARPTYAMHTTSYYNGAGARVYITYYQSQVGCCVRVY